MPDDSNTNNIDNDPHKFLLYGITYLLATPSEFSQNIAPKGDDAMKSFLGEAKIPTDGQTACITFANKLMTQEGLASPPCWITNRFFRHTLCSYAVSQWNRFDRHNEEYGQDLKFLILLGVRRKRGNARHNLSGVL
jgi:hypothetical protein